MKRFLIAAAALSLLGTAAGAQPRHDNDRHDNDHNSQQTHRDNGHPGTNNGFRRHSEWHKGGRVAHNDWVRGHRVDYRARHLRAPPRGYEYREVDGNLILGAVATGLIVSIIANQ